MNRKTASDVAPEIQDRMQRMDEEMVLRGFTRDTRRVYLAHVRRFYQNRQSGDEGDPTGSVAENEEIRQWLLHLMRRGLSHSYVNQALSALRFFHRTVLGSSVPIAGLPRMLTRSGVDALFAGYDHVYERGEAEGLRYIISGGCGGLAGGAARSLSRLLAQL